MDRVYLDYNASTPLAPEVAAKMHALVEGAYGNASSAHWAGVPAREAVELARAQVAGFLGCDPDEVVFTSGGSESNNLAIKGIFYARSDERGRHIITTQVEHPAVLGPCRFLERLGCGVTYMSVDGHGRIDPDELRRSIRPATILISVMHANNEVGTIQPIEECARIARERGIAFHADAAQSAGKIPTRVDELGVDLLSLAGHKLYAPKGVGVLYVRRGLILEPLIHGAGHESGRRAGTESALLCAALGEACKLASDLSDGKRVRELRDRLWAGLRETLGDRVVLFGHSEHRLPNTLNVGFVGQVGADVLARLEGVAASTGAACHAGRIELSSVLAAMGVATSHGVGAVRFSLGRPTTVAEIEATIEKVRIAFGGPG